MFHRLRPLPRALAVALLGGAIAVTLPHARAQAPEPTASAGDARPYTLPAGPLGSVLTQFAAQAGVRLSFDPALTKGKTTAGLAGRYDVHTGFAALLAGSGLLAVPDGQGGYVLSSQAATPSGESTLPAVRVRAAATPAPTFRAASVRSATKTDTAALDVAQTVNVVGPELIREQRVIRLADALRNVAGVAAAGSEGRRDQFTIRGFGAELDMYADGIRDMAYFRDSANIERIEVLKGPAAVLFGRGSAGGIINRVTKKPTADTVREVQATLGSWDYRRAEWDLGGAASESVNLRLTGAYEKGGQFRDQLDNELATLAGSAELRLAPATRLLASLEWQHHKLTPDRGIPAVSGVPADVPVSNFYGEPFDFGKRQVLNGGVTLEHMFSEDTRLKTLLQVNTMDLDAVNTRNTGLSADGTQVTRNTTWFPKQREYAFLQTELTHKTRWAGTEHLWLAGYEHGRQSAHLKVYQVSAPAISLVNPAYTAPSPVFTDANRTFDVAFTGTTDALYLQDQATLSPRWKLVAGLRHDRFVQRQDAGTLLSAASAAIERTDTEWSPRAGVIFQPTPANSLYVTASRSFQPKAADLLYVRASEANLAPTRSTQVEAGSKNEVFDGKLLLNAAVFRVVMNDIATADPNGSGGVVQVGEQVHRGLELEAVGEPAAGWRVQAGAMWLQAEVTRSNDTPVGTRPANVPRRSANLWLSRDLTHGWRAGLGVYHMGERFAAADDTVRLPSYMRWDAALSYTQGPLQLALNLRNLANAVYYESATNNVQLAPGAPRSAMLTARYAF